MGTGALRLVQKIPGWHVACKVWKWSSKPGVCAECLRGGRGLECRIQFPGLDTHSSSLILYNILCTYSCFYQTRRMTRNRKPSSLCRRMLSLRHLSPATLRELLSTRFLNCVVSVAEVFHSHEPQYRHKLLELTTTSALIPGSRKHIMHQVVGTSLPSCGHKLQNTRSSSILSASD